MKPTTLLAVLAAAGLLHACTTAELQAPPAPCASTERDCGPAKPLNTFLAQALPVVVAPSA